MKKTFAWIKNKALMATLAIAALTPNHAFAQLNQPDDTDMSKQFIAQIFGSLLNVSGGTDAFGGGIAIFNGMILAVGGILVAYTLFAGTLGTAHDGEMLGKKFSSVYLPIRTAAGTALILPILPGGYCVMQAIVMWLVMSGSGLANSVWDGYTSNPPALSGRISVAADQSIRKLVVGAYAMNVCVEAEKLALEENPDIIRSTIYEFGYSSKKLSNGTITWFFGDQNLNKSLCGTISTQVLSKNDATQLQTSTHTTSLTSLHKAAAKFTMPSLAPIYEIHNQNVAPVIQKTQALAQKAIVDPSKVSYADLEKIMEEYKNTLLNSTQNIMKDSGFAEAARTQGWFLAGTWATKIIKIQNKINTAVSAVPSATPKIANNNSQFRGNAKNYQINGLSILQEEHPEISGILDEIPGDGSPNSAGNNTKELSSAENIARGLIQAITSIDIENIKSDDRHPLVLMSEIGNRIFTSILVAMIAAAGIGALAGAVPYIGGGVVNSSIAVFSTLGAPLAMLTGVGGTLAYIIPNTPFLIWLGIIIGWSLMVVEAILAAPLWAVMHLNPNGDDLTGRGANGYMLVLGLLLRPTLIIFGLIGAIIFSDLFGRLVNLIFFDMFFDNVGTMAIYPMVFGTGLYAAIMFTVIKNTFMVMHQIPDQLMRWAGGGGEQLGQYAHQMSEGALAKAGMIGASVAATGVSRLAGATAKGLSSGIQNKLNQEQSEARHREAMDAVMGNGAGDILEKTAANESQTDMGKFLFGSQSKSSVNSAIAMDQQNRMQMAIDALGGKNSEAARKMLDVFSDHMKQNPNSTFSEGLMASMPKALDAAYGPGAGSMVSKATNGTFEGSGFASSIDSLRRGGQQAIDQDRQSRQAMSSLASQLTSDSSPIGANMSQTKADSMSSMPEQKQTDSKPSESGNQPFNQQFGLEQRFGSSEGDFKGVGGKN